ncbi:MAG: hypothetical protein KC422_25905 [Trueperaceae bacterium]|nr:hypothetical protein [Trueperaceae bacterium]
MSVKVIGAGFGRTGTATLKLALEHLGFNKCYHSESLGDHPEHASMWIALLQGKQPDWTYLFKGYQAATGLPTVFFYRELMKAYPEAKIILTLRDPERWYESASQTILNLPSRPQFALMRLISLFNNDLKKVLPILTVARKVGIETFFNNDLSKDHVIATFKQHNEEVRQTVPAEHLLEYEVRQGWQPLCEFLKLPVPNEPFPKTNTLEQFQRRLASK